MARAYNNRVYERLETVFQILFLIYTILGYNSVTFGMPVISFFMWASYVLGAYLLWIRVKNCKEYINMPGFWLLFTMCMLCGISILTNRIYNLKKNIIYLLVWVYYFFMYYTQNRKAAPYYLKMRFRILGNVLCLCGFVLALISLIMMVSGYSVITHINGAQVTRGFTHGRLFGAYLTPNTGAVTASIVIFFCIYFLRVYHSTIYRVWLIINLLLQFLYIVFSDSRSGVLSLAFGSAVYVFFTSIGRSIIENKSVRTIVAFSLALVAMAVCIFVPKLVQHIYNDTVNQIANHFADDANIDIHIDSYIVDRGYDLSTDFSNRRFDVWKSGLEIFARNPWLGTSFCGFLPFAQEYMPETYIVSNDYLQMDTLDSDFMNLLVSNGIFAFSAFVCFIIRVLHYVFIHYIQRKRKDPDLPVMLAVCMAASVFSVVTSGVLYMHAPFSAIFWLSLGCIVMIVSNECKGTEYACQHGTN